MVKTVCVFFCFASFCVGADEPKVWRKDSYCGVNCAYMYLRLTGVDQEFNEVENALNPDSTGNSLGELKGFLASKLSGVKVVQMTPDELKEARLPALLLLDRQSTKELQTIGHFVVLVSINDEQAVFVDGTSGVLVAKPASYLTKDWTGYAILQQSKGISRFSLVVFATGVCLLVFGSEILNFLFNGRSRTLSTLVFLMLLSSPSTLLGFDKDDVLKSIHHLQSDLQNCDFVYEVTDHNENVQSLVGAGRFASSKGRRFLGQSREQIRPNARQQFFDSTKVFDGRILYVVLGNSAQIYDKKAAAKENTSHFNCTYFVFAGIHMPDPMASERIENSRSRGMPEILLEESDFETVPMANPSEYELKADCRVGETDIGFMFRVDAALKHAIVHTEKTFANEKTRVVLTYSNHIKTPSGR